MQCPLQPIHAFSEIGSLKGQGVLPAAPVTMSVFELPLTGAALMAVGMVAAVLEAVGLAFQSVPGRYGGEGLLVALSYELYSRYQYMGEVVKCC